MRQIIILLILFLASIDILAVENVCHVDSMISIDIRHGLPESRVRGLYSLSDGRLAVLTPGYLAFYDGITFNSVPVEYENGFEIETIGKNRIVSQDNDGRLWLKTPSTRNDKKSRVNVFDVTTGEDITMGVISKICGLKIRGLYVDEAGDVWIIDQDNNLAHVQNDTNQKCLSLASIGKDMPFWLSVKDGKIYLLYGDGKVCVVSRDSGMIEYMACLPLTGENWRLINSGIKWHNGRLWLSFYVPGNNDKGLIAVLDPLDGSWSMRHLNEIVNDFIIDNDENIIYGFDEIKGEVSCVLRDQNDGIWIGTINDGLRYINPRRLLLVKNNKTPERLPKTGYYPTERCHKNGLKYADGSVNSSVEDIATGFVFLATRKGLYVIDENDRLFGVIDEKYGLPHSNVQSVIADIPRNIGDSDSIGDVWFATTTSLSRLRYLPEKRFEIIHTGILDGLDLEGKEFISQSMTLDSCGLLKVAYPGGHSSLNPKDLCDSDYVKYDFPSKLVGKLQESSDASRLSILWWILGLIFILSIFFVISVYLKRKKRVAIDTLPSEKVRVEEDVSGSLSVLNHCDTLINKVKEEVSISSEDTPSSQDIDFENRLNNIIFGHLDDETLNVASLSGMMAMDRTNLYRKMQSVFGLSPSVYIRNVRLEAACRLLKETDLPIVEVAMRTGFSSAKYFSSTFKEKYGILPSKFRAEL
ncbi:MAG: helix-turn-helix transcriptional regulator [Muribaculaceae bacterium]|nr:helix-turn-helix transcriptional regulator [Muribaculaceae bacterium]